jgi:hypothetical protein
MPTESSREAINFTGKKTKGIDTFSRKLKPKSVSLSINKRQDARPPATKTAGKKYGG